MAAVLLASATPWFSPRRVFGLGMGLGHIGLLRGMRWGRTSPGSTSGTIPRPGDTINCWTTDAHFDTTQHPHSKHLVRVRRAWACLPSSSAPRIRFAETHGRDQDAERGGNVGVRGVLCRPASAAAPARNERAAASQCVLSRSLRSTCMRAH
jgi:hypothetical protein